MSATPRDLTRWNRAGLPRFRYVDGNAATFLEELRQALHDRFPAGSRAWLERVTPPAGAESESERAARLLEQYGAERGDLAWETARAFARACHLLTEHLDAYANEGFLGTATQWESVRRLVDMLDVYPAPPASASTFLALEAKAGRTGVVERGFQVKHTPPTGGAPVIFETLEDLEVDPALNELRPAGFNRHPEEVKGSVLEIAGAVPGLKTGEPLVIEDERTGALHAYLIRGVLEGEEITRVEVSPNVESRVPRGYAKIHVAPKDRLRPQGPGSVGATLGRTIQLADDPEGLLPGHVIWIGDGQKSLYRRVEHVRGRRLILTEDVGDLRVEQAKVGRPTALPVASLVRRDIGGGAADVLAVRLEGDWSRLTGQRVGDHAPNGTVTAHTVFGAQYHPVVAGSNDPDAGFTVLRMEWRLPADSRNPQALLAPPADGGTWQAARFLREEKEGWRSGLVTSQPKQTGAGDLAVVVSGGRAAWGRLSVVEVDSEAKTATLRAAEWRDRGGHLFFLGETTVYAHFSRQERLVGWHLNPTPLTGKRVPLDSPPAALSKGRRLLLALSDLPRNAVAAQLVILEGNDLVLDRTLPEGARYDNLVILGNAPLAGHGEAKAEKVIGSGDASLSGQEMVLEEKGISFVADAAQPGGVRADVVIRIGDRTWQQVPTLADSGPADPHYTVRMTEEGWIRLTFGDGRNGRRLPTGVNNVRAAFRVGVGLAGNLPAGSLVKAARPHTLVEAVRQPLPAAGGNDMEGVESLRETAPASLSTLGRAVSLTDFGRLAASQSSVWQARAFPLRTGLQKHESVRVVVVPAGGGPLNGLAASIRDFLLAHSLPAVEVQVERYQPVALSLSVTARINTAEYDPEAVVAAVRSRLLEAFGLRTRRLGQPLRLSEVFQVVEGVSGVANSTAELNGDSSLTRVPAPADGVVALDVEGSKLTVSYEEHTL